MAASAAELNLVDKGLYEIPDELARSRCGTTRTLNLAENSVRPPGGLQYFTQLDTLILDKNELDSLAGFPAMPSLRTLWINNNRFDDVCGLMDDVVKLFPNVTYLSAMRNPASPPLVCMSEEDAAATRRFRLYVIYRLPKLQFLDAAPVTATERADAASQGAFLVVRKPKKSASSTGSAGTSKGGVDAASLFFGGDAASGAAAAAAAEDTKKSSAYLGLGTTYYDGRHSEGNRFINDRHL